MSVRRSITYAGLTFSLAALAFSFGSWTAQRSIAQQLASNDARLTALRDDMARAILEHLRGPGPHARGCWVLDALLRGAVT